MASTKNLPVSILRRLRNKAAAEGRNAQDLLRYYAIERFLYRMAQSPYADRFVLKGALIFLTWGIDLQRLWRTFVTRSGLETGVALDFLTVVEDLRVFVSPLFHKETLIGQWSRGHTWV